MKKVLLCLGILMAISANATTSSVRSENALILRDALKDQKITAQIRQKEAGLKSLNKLLGFKSLNVQSCQQKCEAVCDDGSSGGNGSTSCWDKCTAEGYGSSTCSTRCGTSTSGGSQSCWDKCQAEGYGSSTCSTRCGTDTSGGSASCWDKCTAEGYGSSTCSTRCGTDTSGGSSACWEKCTAEGYGSSTCSSRCGTN